jgi:monothiol glutaredoxin
MALNEATRKRIESLIPADGVVLFMKGNRSQPQCGFSARVVQMLDSVLPGYATVDVLSDPEIRDGIKEFSDWPTIPQLYVKGEFVGGCDIVTEMYASGELHETLGLQAPERRIPKITVTDAAAVGLRGHLENAPDGVCLFLGIDAGFDTQLGLRPRSGHEVEVESNGIVVLMDAVTAERADGVVIDLVEGLGGASFKVENPNAPAAVRQLAPGDIKKLIDDGVRFEFLDVRTPEERETARIAGSRLLDAETAQQLESLPRDSMLVFHCHHGGRSQQAAEHFRRKGFANVVNMAGGIDAWAVEVDPTIPRY